MFTRLPRACIAGGGSAMRHHAKDYEQWAIDALNQASTQSSAESRDVTLARAKVFAQLAIAASMEEHHRATDNGDRS